jgi:hypothetical protein
VNRLLDEVGIKSEEHRVKIITSLGTRVVSSGRPVHFLALQGSALALWEGRGMGAFDLWHKPPIPRSAMLERIDLLLFGDRWVFPRRERCITMHDGLISCV